MRTQARAAGSVVNILVYYDYVRTFLFTHAFDGCHGDARVANEGDDTFTGVRRRPKYETHASYNCKRIETNSQYAEACLHIFVWSATDKLNSYILTSFRARQIPSYAAVLQSYGIGAFRDLLK